MESAYLAPSLRAAALVLAMPLVGVAARAQCSYPDMQLGNFICTPTSTSGAYTSITSGDLNGNLSPEVGVTRSDGSLIVYHDVDSENVAVVVANDAIDVCYSPSSAGANSPGFLYTSASGLHRVVYDAVGNKYETEDVATTSLWQATTRIRWAKAGIGASGLEGLVGWAPSLDTIFFSTSVGGVVSVPTSQFTYTPDVTDFVLLDWDGVPGLELAVLHGTGLHILDQSGTVLLSRTASFPGDAITAVRCEGYKDSLAWVTRMPNGTSALLLFNLDFAGNHVQGPLLLGTDVYSSIAAGDLISAPQGSEPYTGPDGDEDLVLASSTTSVLRIYRVDTSAQGDWISGTHRTMDLTGPFGSATPTGPVLCDNLFNDWTADGDPIPSIAVALSAPNGLRVKPEPMARPDALVEDYTEVAYRSGLHLDGCTPPGPPYSASKWTIVLGDGWGTTSATEIQMVVRLCEEEEEEVEPGVYHSATFPLSGQGQIVDTEIYFNALETSEEGVDCELSERKYFVKIRPRNASQVWRWSIISVSPTCAGMEWLRDRPGASETVVQIAAGNFLYCEPGPLEFSNCPGYAGGEYIPVAVPQLFIPSSPGVLPAPPPPQ